MERLTITLLAVGLCALAASAAEPEAFMDAAEVFSDGTEMDGFAAVRLSATAGDTDLTNVRFKMDVRSPAFWQPQNWVYDDPTCPWHLAKPARVPVGDGTFWSVGLVWYTHTAELAPIFLRWGEEVTYEIRDTVPAGYTWDIAVKITGSGGADVELFSTASGELLSDDWSATLLDPDRSPQSVPEPASLVLLACGGLPLLLRRARG